MIKQALLQTIEKKKIQVFLDQLIEIEQAEKNELLQIQKARKRT